MWFDVLTVVILAFTTYRGATKGFVWQLAAIGALLLCFLFATPMSLAIAPAISVEPPLNRWIAMILVYAVCSFAAFAAARLLRDALEKAKFVEFDKHLGAVFGFLKGVTICLVVTFFTVTLSESARGHILESRAGYAAAIIMDRLHPVMPAELHDVLEPYIHRLDHDGLDLKHRHADGEHGHDGHDHGDHPHADPFNPARPGTSDPWAGNPFGQDSRPGTPVPNEPTFDDPFASAPKPSQPVPAGDSVWVFAAKLIGKSNAEVRDEVVKYLSSRTPAERATLVDQLSLAIPNLLEIIQGAPPAGPLPQPAQASRDERNRLLDEIAAVYSDFRNGQQAMIEEVESSLQGIPDQVALAVLRDWRSDLLSIDRSTDPDPGTGINTRLDTRIVRQLDAARVPLSTLSSQLQSRLRGVQRQ